MSTRARDFNSRYNFKGITHKCYPFMFRLTLCGLPVRRVYKVTLDRKRSHYQECKRCYR